MVVLSRFNTYPPLLSIQQTEDNLVRASKELMRRIEDVVDLYTGGNTDKFVAMVEVSSQNVSFLLLRLT
jgi:hypothetical protein